MVEGLRQLGSRWGRFTNRLSNYVILWHANPNRACPVIASAPPPSAETANSARPQAVPEQPQRRRPPVVIVELTTNLRHLGRSHGVLRPSCASYFNALGLKLAMPVQVGLNWYFN